MKNRGFTLVEILVVSAIFGVIMLYSYKLLFTANANFLMLQNKIDTITEKDKIFAKISDEIRAAKNIIAGDKNKLVLWRADIDNNNQPAQDECYFILNNQDNSIVIDNKIISDKIQLIEFFFDEPPPAVSHIIVKLKLLNSDNIFFNSVCLRNKIIKN